jgi:hypothetical protein
MALLIANQDFSVEVAGADVEVKRGDFWDSTTALAIAVSGAGLLSVLPDGITTHQITGDWEG